MKLEVSGSRVEIVEDETLVAGEVKVHATEFDFGESWGEYPVKVAVFKNGGVEVEQLIVDGACEIPWEALVSPGELYIGVRGESADKRRPTLWSEAVTVNEGTEAADESREPTPDVWQQLLAAIDDVAPHIGEDGHWYVGDVDTGVPAQGEQGIQGERGVHGEPGADGYTPVRGTDYWTESDKAEIKAYVDEAILGGAW